jgi:hypothetical protein
MAMSGTNSSMHLGIDASGAKQGADQFTAAITKIGAAVDRLDKATDVAFSKIKARLAGLDFSKVARDVGVLGSIKVDASLATNLTKLSSAIASFRPISAQTTSQLSAFAKALAQFHNPSADPAKLHALAQAVSGFRAPSQQQTANLQAFVHALNNIRITANIGAIVSQLHAITAAAQQARSALAGIGPANVRTPRPAGAGSGGRGYGPRSSLLTGPYDGVFSGANRATGELRGLENVANPSFQAASIMRAAVPALTSGAFIKALYDEGQALTAFQHTLEIATTVPGDAVMSQRKLGDAMQFVSDIANKYGLNLVELRQGFGLFAATAHVAGYTMGETKKVYEDTASSLRAVGASTEKQAQVWRALDTVMSQGFVSMLQLHRQIAPALPGVQISMAEVLFRAKNNLAAEVKLSAKQLDDAEKLLNELSRKKQITPEALFQAMALTREKTAAGLPTALASPQSALERFKTQWTLTLDAMNKNGVWDAMGAQFNRFADMLKRDDIASMFAKIAHGIADALRLMGDAVDWASNHLSILVPLLEAFVLVGAAEAGLRLVTAFTSLGGLIAGLVAPFAQVVRLGGELVSSGLDVMLGKVSAQAALASGAMRALSASVNLAMAATVLAIGASTAVMVANENELSAMGNRTQTFGEHMRTMWDAAKQGGSEFGSSLLSLGQTFGMISGSATSWGDVIENAMVNIGVAVANVTINILNDMRDIIAFTKNLPTNLGRMVLSGQAADFLGLAAAPPAEHIPNVTAEGVRAGIVARTKERLDREKALADAAAAAKPPPPAPLPDEYAPKRPVIGSPAASKGKSEAEKAQDHLDSMLKSLTPDLAMVERFQEEMDAINKAQAMGVHSKGAQGLASLMPPEEAKAFLSGEYARAIQSAKDKLLEAAGAVTPYQKALRELSIQEQRYTALVSLGLISSEKKNQLMAQATEHLQKQLNPFAEYNKQLDIENGLLLMGNKQREVQTKLQEMIKQAREDGKPLDDAEIAALKKKLELHQQLQQYAANQNVGLQAWANSFQDLYTELGKVEQKIAGDLSNALTKFITTGKMDFKSLADSILNDLTRVMVNSVMRDGMKMLGLIDEKDGADPKGASFLPQLLGIAKPDIPGQPGSGGGSWISKLFGGGDKKPAADNGAAGPNTIEGAMSANGGALPVVIAGKTDGVGGPDMQSQFDKTAQSAGAANDNKSNGSGSVDNGTWDMSTGSSGSTSKSGSSDGGGLDGLFDKLFNSGGVMGTLLGAGGGALGAYLGGKKWGAAGSIGGGVAGSLAGKLLGSLFSGKGGLGSLFGSSGSGGGGLFSSIGKGISSLFSSGSSSSGMDFSAADNYASWSDFAAAQAPIDAANSGFMGSPDMFNPGSDLMDSGLYSEGGFSGSPLSRSMMPSHVWASRSIPSYADGTHNTSGGIPSILHPNEAVIPLSRGRKIPIEAANGNSLGGGGPVTVNFNVSTPDADSFRASESQMHARLGSTIQRAVARNG